MIASWFGCGRRSDNHNGKSDGYAAASIRSAATKSRLTAAAKPGPATVPNHNPQPQVPAALRRRGFRPAQTVINPHYGIDLSRGGIFPLAPNLNAMFELL